ncbi:MAG: penicillin acylase family protein [Alphaproteobacteria bacterium]|nr:penicillin acylase family protein [Alphaproteobacteria bacterium]
MRVIFRSVLIVLAVIVLSGGALIWILGVASVPDVAGDETLPGLNAEVTVITDDRGIPVIRAESLRDAYRALGFLHARDRLWQMETTRRIGAGRMAEIVGAPMLNYDRMMRELGLYRQAEQQVEALSQSERDDLQAYADGVNAFLENTEAPLPVEFQLTLHSPDPWVIADSLVWGRLMSLQLSGNGFSEGRREALIDLVGAERVRELFPRNLASPSTMNDDNRDAWIGKYDASNAWVLSGKRTETGKPILANDPHLGLRMPGQWYLARIQTPELSLTGATAPGAPFHILGHNGTVAWGLTTTHADNQDTVRLDQEAFDASEVRQETIQVRFGADETITIRDSAFGPVLSRLGDPPVALQWTGTKTLPRSVQALYHLNRAQDWDQFLRALALFDDPVQNVFYADTAGRIGMKVAGRLPVRHGGDGTVPNYSAQPEATWRGVLPSQDLPGLVDPANGLIANANNRVVSADYPNDVSHDFVDEYRAVRLLEALSEVPEAHTLEDSARIQNDVLSDAARRLVPHFLKAAPTSPLARDARNLLRDWDYRMTRDSAAAAIYMTMLNEAVRLLAEDDLGADAFEAYWRADARFVEEVLTVAPHWCDDTRTDPEEDCSWMLSSALDRAVFVLNDDYGSDASAWRWGDLHTAPMENFLLDLVPGLSSLGNRPLETNGGDHTINRGQSRGGDGRHPFRHIHGAGYRAIYDLSDLDNSLYALAGGQSGNPFSPHYDDLLEPWRDGRYFRIPGRTGDIGEESGDVLHLRP